MTTDHKAPFLMSVRVMLTALGLLSGASVRGNPFPDPDAVFQDEPPSSQYGDRGTLQPEQLAEEGKTALRVQVAWKSSTNTYEILSVESEQSGTDALYAASRTNDPHGSFRGRLVNPSTGRAEFFSTIGTGVAYRYLARVLTFRFPMPQQPMLFEFEAENAATGVMETVLKQEIKPESATPIKPVGGIQVRTLRTASASPKLIVNIYAEGYQSGRADSFFQDAAKIPATLASYKFPMLEHLEFRAVFAPSNESLGTARNLGLPVPVRDSFLGLYFPYWYDFGRYYHVVYPTSEIKYRRSIGSVPYDYPIALVDDAQYWGVGNFKELTAIPARNSSFVYLLLHEFGHFFGLNEEYEGGGPTELAFAPGIKEPWSQNITFQKDRSALKWRHLVDAGTATPTPHSSWQAGRYGAYEGGYGSTPKPGRVYKPGFACTMESGRQFCAVCREALTHRIKTDLGTGPGSGGSQPQQSWSCRADDDGRMCSLYKGTEKVASTPLFGSWSCDQNFCNRYFKVARGR